MSASSSSESSSRNPGAGTRFIHSGQKPDPHSGAVMPPISMSSTFVQKSPGVFYPGGYEYSRAGNPTREAFEAAVAGAEKAKFGLAFASGLAATATVMHLLKTGDEVIAMDDMYGGTGRYFQKVAEVSYGIKFVLVDATKEGAMEEALTDKTRLVWAESPTNPMLTVIDLEKAAAFAKKNSLLFVVDNTFLSPYLQNPLELGADIVLHSVSKYINGHSDVVMGAVATNDEDLYKRLKFTQNAMGVIPSPFDSYLALRGIKTLHLRMEAHERNANKIAEHFEGHAKLERVIYPGLKSHAQHELAGRQQRGYGGMISVVIKGDLAATRRFMENLQVFSLAESLGGVESLANHPAIMTHASVPAERRAKLGITDSLVRLSIGVEETEDLINDIEHALSFV